MPKLGAKPRAVIYWGALWGLSEATAGALLHLLPCNIGALIWLPLAARCLLGAYRATRSPLCVLIAACLAAALKLTNLLTPLRLDVTLNPAAAIVMEGMAFALALTLARGVKYNGMTTWRARGARAALLLGANTLWRALYAVYIALAPEWIRAASALASRAERARFFIGENLATTLIICALCLLSAALKTNHAPERRAPVALLAGMCALNLIV